MAKSAHGGDAKYTFDVAGDDSTMDKEFKSEAEITDWHGRIGASNMQVVNVREHE